MWANGKSYDEIRREMGEDDLFKSIELSKISKSTPKVVEGIFFKMECLVITLGTNTLQILTKSIYSR